MTFLFVLYQSLYLRPSKRKCYNAKFLQISSNSSTSWMAWWWVHFSKFSYLAELYILYKLHFSGIDSELLAEEQADSGVDGDSGEDEGSSSRLWVDQFSPQHYTDLLSDDVSHRNAVHLKIIPLNEDIYVYKCLVIIYFCLYSSLIAVCWNG